MVEKIDQGSYKKLISKIWICYIIVVLAIPVYLFTIKINFLNLYGELPSLYVLENPKNDFSSELYSADGVLLGKYFRSNRSPVEYDELSPNLINALLATEDYRFEKHSGIDLRGLLRAFFLSILLQKNRGGGSTISQQLAKNLFKTRSNKYNGILTKVPLIGTLVVKTKEWIVAVQLEQSYTKQEIATMYLNTVSFGSNAFGIKVASKIFFNTTPDLLTMEQAALLIGILRAPSYYSPVKYPSRAMTRRNTVLWQLCKYNFITKEKYEELITLPIDLVYKVEDHNMGPATYFRSVIRDFLLRWTQKRGYDLFEDGLKIYTTIDSRLQRHAEEAVSAHMKELQARFVEHWGDNNPWVDNKGTEIEGFIEAAVKRTDKYKKLVEEYGNDVETINKIMNTPVPTKLFSWDGEIDAVISPIEEIKYNKKILHTGFMAMEPSTGHIKAWVGGINYRHFKYDHVMQGKRQPGSAFKPIVYAAAIDNGYTPWQEVVDAPITFRIPGDPPTWTPQNWTKKYTGHKMTLRQAMSKSVNSITAYLMKQLGPEMVVEYAKRLGITSPLDATPSLCLGTGDVSVYELVGAYSVFMNKGGWIEPFYITRIEDKNGRVIEEFVPQKREAISETTAYLMVHMLKGLTEETSQGINSFLKEDNEIGGKTGTTSNHSDGWFIGMVRGLCAGAWVGGEDRCIHFKTMAQGAGARVARPLWEKFMISVYNDPDLHYEKGPILNYPKPEGLEMPKDKRSKGLNCPPSEDDLILEENVIELDEEGIF